jgi:hypothetical protein
LAANNGDTLGKVVISVKNNEFRSGRQEKFQLETTNRKFCTSSSSTIFFNEVLKMQANNSLKDQQAMIFMIESSILLAWPLLPAGVHSLDRVSI